MENDSFFQELQDYVAQGETEKAIEKLLGQLSELDADLYQQILVLSGRFSKLKREKNLGLTPTENENEILLAIVQMIGELKHKHAGVLTKAPGQLPATAAAPRTEGAPAGKKSLPRWAVFGGGVVVLFLGFFLLQGLFGGGGDEEYYAFSETLTNAELGFFTGYKCEDVTALQTTFTRSEVNSLNYCLHLTYPELTEPAGVDLKVEYQLPNDDLVSFEYVADLNTGWNSSFHSGEPLGALTDNLPTGAYKVVVYLNETPVASGGFTVE